MLKRFAAIAIATAMFALPALADNAADVVESMKERCLWRASNELMADTSEITVEYGGKLDDGNHAINGTAFVDGREETFRCTFCRSGRRLLEFAVD